MAGRPRTPEEPIGIGLLGTGDIARRQFVPAVKGATGARLVAVLSRDVNRAKAFAETVGAPEAYHDLADLLASPNVHAVIVASPDAVHESQVIAAARAGVHVLCEKPLTTTVVAGRRMVDVVAESGITFGMGYTFRHLKVLGRVREIVRSGALGRLHLVRGIWSWRATPIQDAWCNDPRFARYWALARIGTHLIDICRWYLGEPLDVQARLAAPRTGGPNDELSTLALSFPDGVIAQIAVSVLFDHGNALEIYGDQGALIALGIFRHSPEDFRITVNDTTMLYPSNNAFADEVSDFVRAIKTGEPTSSLIQDGLRNLEIMERARQSSEAGTALSINRTPVT